MLTAIRGQVKSNRNGRLGWHLRESVVKGRRLRLDPVAYEDLRLRVLRVTTGAANPAAACPIWRYIISASEAILAKIRKTI